MEHPLLPSLDNLTLEELGSKISELHKKLAIAQKMGNGYLCNQIRMALESYNNKYQIKTQEVFKKNNPGGDDFNTKIDIT